MLKERRVVPTTQSSENRALYYDLGSKLIVSVSYGWHGELRDLDLTAQLFRIKACTFSGVSHAKCPQMCDVQALWRGQQTRK